MNKPHAVAYGKYSARICSGLKFGRFAALNEFACKKIVVKIIIPPGLHQGFIYFYAMGIKYLWVDKIFNGILGETKDIGKIHYNIELMGDYGKELEQSINIKLLLVDRNIEAVFSVGKFVCVVHINKRENTASMEFCDSQTGNKSLWEGISKQLYPQDTAKFIRVYNDAVLSSLLEGDLFKLSFERKS